MPRLPKLLLDDETVLQTTRTHIKVLVVPFLLGIVIMLAAGFALSKIGGSGGGIPRLVVIVVAVGLLIWATIIPWLRWVTWSYTLTDRRIIEQRGILTREGRVIPLTRVNDVSYEKHLTDRILRCGTLIVHDASEQAGLRMHDIPQIEDFHRRVSRMLFDLSGGDERRVDTV